MKIENIIYDAILEHKDITLDNIGTFVCRRTSAVVDSDSKTIVAPQYSIGFEAGKSGVSIISLIEAEMNLSSQEAATLYAEWIKSIEKVVRKVQIIKIEEVGTIIKSRKEVQFNCEQDLISVISLLEDLPMIETEKELEVQECEEPALPIVEASEEVQEVPQEEKAEQEVEDDAEEEGEATDEDSSADEELQELAKQNEYYRNRAKLWRNISILFLVLYIVSAIVALFIYTQKPREVVKEVVVEKIIEVPAATVSKEDSVAVISSSNMFQIVGGVFSTKERAENAVKAFAKEGFNSAFVTAVANNTKFRVTLESFATEAEAENRLSQLLLNKESSSNDQFWIFSDK